MASRTVTGRQKHEISQELYDLQGDFTGVINLQYLFFYGPFFIFICHFWRFTLTGPKLVPCIICKSYATNMKDLKARLVI